MTSAYVLVQAEPGRSGRIRRELEALADVAEAVAIAGPYDIIARIEGGPAACRRVLDEHIRLAPGVLRAHACIPLHGTGAGDEASGRLRTV